MESESSETKNILCFHRHIFYRETYSNPTGSARKFRIIFLQGTFPLYFLVVVSRELFLGLKAPSLLDTIILDKTIIFFVIFRSSVHPVS